MIYKIAAASLLIASTLITQAQKVSLPKVFADAEKQTQVMLKEIPEAKAGKSELVSPRTLEDGKLKLVTSRDWTSGFFPGVLWFLNEYTGKKTWRSEERKQMAAHTTWGLKCIAVLEPVTGLQTILIIRM